MTKSEPAEIKAGISREPPPPEGSGLVSLFFDPALARNEVTQLKGKMLEYGVVGLVVIFIAAYEWLRRLVGLPQHLVWIVLFAAGIAAYCAVRIALLSRRLGALVGGENLWRSMRLDFESLGERGFYLFDGLKDSRGLSLGPILVGPTGVFSLNIRSNPRSGALFEKIDHVDAQSLLISGHPALADPLGQARASAERVRSWLKRGGVGEVPVTPMLIYPGWNLGRRPPDERRDVLVANERTLASEVLSCPRRLEPRDIIPICQALSAESTSPQHG
jgi:hypothetical protein